MTQTGLKWILNTTLDNVTRETHLLHFFSFLKASLINVIKTVRVMVSLKDKQWNIYIYIRDNIILIYPSDKDRPRRLANRNCDIRGQEDDLSCREGGEMRDKLWVMAGDILGLGVVFTVYRIVSQ